MTFPQVPLDLGVDLDVGSWTSIRSYVYQRRKVPAITRGRAPESPTPVAATFSAELNDRDGRFSPHNPTGAYFGSLGRNTPLRAHVPAPTSYLRLEDGNTSYCSCPSTSALNVAGDLELRIDLELSNWTSSILAAKYGGPSGTASWAWGLNADGTLFFGWFTAAAAFAEPTSAVPLPWPGGRISLRVTLAQATGTLTFWYGTSVDGPWTQLGAAQAGTAGVVQSSTADVTVGYDVSYASLTGYAQTLGGTPGQVWKPLADLGLQGSVYEFRIYDGIGGTLVADPVFSAQADGATSFTDAQGNTWACSGTAAISARDFRFHGEVSEWPPRSDETGNDVSTDITASGLLRRLSQGKAAPIGSTMTRAWRTKTGIYAPVAYWPAEDGNNSQVVTLGLVSSSNSNPDSIASGLANGSPMTISGARKTTFASSSVTGLVSTSPLPVPHTDTWTGIVPAYTPPASSPANVWRFILAAPSGGDTDTAVLARLFSTGTAARIDVQYGVANSGSIQLTGYNSSGTQVFSSGGYVTFGVNGGAWVMEVALTVSGGTLTWHVNGLQLGASTQVGASGTFSGSLGRATKIVINPNGSAVSSALGQFACQSSYDRMDTATSADSIIGPFNAWAGETAGLRFARLCAEEGIACRVVGYPAASVQMGGQTPQTLLNLLQECETADHGVIFEPRQALALAYRTSASLCAQDRAISGSQPLALSYTAAQLGEGAGKAGLIAVDDDQLTVNDELVTRGSGSVTGSLFEATETGAVFSTGALSIADPPGGAGLYQEQQTVNVYADGQLGDQAGWLVHLGTVNEPRYTGIPVNLARSQLASLQHQVAALDIGDYLRIADAPSWLTPDAIKTLIWGYTETLGGYTWSLVFGTRPESPYEVMAAGSGAVSDCRLDADGSSLVAPVGDGANLLASPGFETGVITPWQALNGATAAVQSAQVHSGTFAASLTPDGVSAYPTLESGHVAVTAGQPYSAAVWALASAALASHVYAAINWYDASGTYLSTTAGTAVTLSTSAWAYLTAAGTAPAGAAYAACAPAISGTPAAAEVAYFDDASFAAGAPFALTVVPGVPWTQDAADFPFDLAVGGERMTATAAAAGPGGALVGSLFSNLQQPDFARAYSVWQSWTGVGIGVTRVYKAHGDYSYDSNMQEQVANGVKICLSLRPSATPVSAADLASVETMMQTLQAAGANVAVTLWHEPHYAGLTAAQYIAMVAYYGPTVRKYYPLWFVTSESAVAFGAENTYYPGDDQVDGVATDIYYSSRSNPLSLCAQPAVNAHPPKPFGIWEYNVSDDPVNGVTQANGTTFLQYIQSFMQTVPVAGDVILFNGNQKSWLGDALTVPAGFEGAITGWQAFSGASVALDTTDAHSGSSSLLVTATGAGVCHFGYLSTGTSGMPCAAGDSVTMSAWIKALTTAENCYLVISWYDATGTSLSNSQSAATVDAVGSWTFVQATFTAPASAAFALPRVWISMAATGEQHRVDDVQIVVDTTDLATQILFPWDYRVALWQAMHTAITGRSAPQVLTVTRSVNGVVKSHAAGEPVNVFQPAYLALI